jgi:hypothetical protein
MDDELQQLEAELTRLRPVVPAPSVAARIDRDLGAGKTQRRTGQAGTWHWLWAAALPAAAALAILLVLSRPPANRAGNIPASPAAGSAAAAPATLKPIAAENILYAAQDEGYVTLADGTTARRERLQYLDTITWRNPRTNASLKWTVPREEVRVVPVSFQ